MFHFELKQLIFDLLKQKVGPAGESGRWAAPYRINGYPAQQQENTAKDVPAIFLCRMSRDIG